MSRLSHEAERQMLQLVKNALFVAGQEMGEKGDHWPLIKMTLRDVIRDYEKLEEEREIQAELKKELHANLMAMERRLLTCSPEDRAFVEPRVREMRELFEATFEEVQDSEIEMVDVELPQHVTWARTILETLDDDEET